MRQDSSHETGVVPTTGNNKELTRARDRKASAALAMKMGGAEWHEICDALGYPTERAALVAVEVSLGKKLNEFDRTHLRALAAGRLESLVRSTWVKAHSPKDPEHLPAVKATRENIESYVRLLGLAAPQEILITNPTQEHLDRWVAQVVSSNLPQVAEADIVEGDVIDDEQEAS